MAQSRHAWNRTGWHAHVTAAAASAAICLLFIIVIGSAHIQPAPPADRTSLSITLIRVPDVVRPAPAIPIKRAGAAKDREARPSRDQSVTAKIADPAIERAAAHPDVDQADPTQVVLPPAQSTDSRRSLRLDIGAAMANTQAPFRDMAGKSGVDLQHGVMSKDERLAFAVTSAEKRDCLGPRKDLVADLVQLAIYLKTIASGKCKGQ